MPLAKTSHADRSPPAAGGAPPPQPPSGCARWSAATTRASKEDASAAPVAVVAAAAEAVVAAGSGMMFYFVRHGGKSPRAMPAELTDVWAWGEDEPAAPSPVLAASARAAATREGATDVPQEEAAGAPAEDAAPARLLALLEDLEEAQRRALQTTSAGLVALMVLLTALLLHVERGNARLRRMEELAHLPRPP